MACAEKQTQRVDYTPYEGFNQQGRVLHAFLRGNKVVSNAELVNNKPLGKYLLRNTSFGGNE
jgi:dihydropyrimidinase